MFFCICRCCNKHKFKEKSKVKREKKMNFAYGFDSNRYRPIVWLCQYGFFPISFKKTDFTKEMHSRQTPGRHIAHIFLRFWIQIKNCNLIRFLCRIFRHIYWIFKIWISTNWFIWIWYVCELCISWNMNRMMAPIQFQKGKKIDFKRFSIISLSNFFFFVENWLFNPFE